MHPSSRILAAVTVLNAALALVAVSQWHVANAAAAGAADVLRARKLEIVDERGRVRASIVVHPADARARMPDGSPQEESVVLRLINGDGRPGVKLASSENDVGLALIRAQGHYIQVFADGVKVTADGRQRATWP